MRLRRLDGEISNKYLQALLVPNRFRLPKAESSCRFFSPLSLESIPADATLYRQILSAFQAPVQLASDYSLTGIIAELRGKVARTHGVRMRVLVAVGNVSRVWEFPTGEGFPPGEVKVEQSLDGSIFDLERWQADTQTGNLKQGGSVGVTVLLEAQKTSRDDTYLATIDSLDLALVTEPAPPAGGQSKAARRQRAIGGGLQPIAPPRSAEVSIAGMSNRTGRLRGNGATRSSTSLFAATSCQEMFACRSRISGGGR